MADLRGLALHLVERRDERQRRHTRIRGLSGRRGRVGLCTARRCGRLPQRTRLCDI